MSDDHTGNGQYGTEPDPGQGRYSDEYRNPYGAGADGSYEGSWQGSRDDASYEGYPASSHGAYAAGAHEGRGRVPMGNDAGPHQDGFPGTSANDSYGSSHGAYPGTARDAYGQGSHGSYGSRSDDAYASPAQSAYGQSGYDAGSTGAYRGAYQGERVEGHGSASFDRAPAVSASTGSAAHATPSSGHHPPLAGEEPKEPKDATSSHGHAEAAPKGGPSGIKTFFIAFAGAIAACAVAFGVTFGTGLLSVGGQDSPLSTTPNSTIEVTDEDVTLPEAVAEKCLPSVVSIDVFSGSSSGSSLFDRYFGSDDDDSLELASLGSGVILSEDGYIVTNYHVVEGGKAYQVAIQGEWYDADLVGSEPSSDIAVLKVKDGSGFTPIEVADSDDIHVGEWVMSIGNPYGLEQSVATGIVSATDRSQTLDTAGDGTGETVIYANLIQTDAAINPGNSGGALVNANGELIGINTLIISESGNYSGLGFAIPSNYAVNVADSIMAGEEPSHAQLGVTMITVDESVAERFDLSSTSGAYVTGVEGGSAADEAGIKEGDVIVRFDGQEVSSSSDLMLDVRSKRPGDKVTLSIERDGKTSDVEVTLGSSS